MLMARQVAPKAALPKTLPKTNKLFILVFLAAAADRRVNLTLS